jgi:putative serine protease PepD
METHDQRAEEPHGGSSTESEPVAGASSAPSSPGSLGPSDSPASSGSSGAPESSGSGSSDADAYVRAWPPAPRTPGDDETGPQGQYGGPGHYGQPGQYAQQGQYGTPGHYTGQYGQAFGQPGYGQEAYAGAGYGAGAPGGPAWWTPKRKLAAGSLALALVLGGGLAGGAVAAMIGNGGTTYTSPTAVKAASSKSATGVAAIAQAVQPSTVSITVTTQQSQDEGTGVIIRSDGVIMTNNHVVADAVGGGQISVKFNDGKKVPADIVGTDPATDLAVIKASGVSGLKPVTFGDSDQLQVGDPVVAIGSPLGLEGSVTSGIVSALHRTLTESGDQQQPQQPLPGFPGFPGFGGGQGGQGGGQQGGGSGGTAIGDAIQTDAAINPGNSGGPLVNGSGQVIGINTAIATSGGGNGNIGVGFAIPINTAKQVSEQLIKTGKATHAYLGVTLSDAQGDQQGALVATVQGGTPAASAGLTEGDVVTAVDGKPIDGADALSAAIRGHNPGDKIALTYVRNGSKHTVDVQLASTSGT